MKFRKEISGQKKIQINQVERNGLVFKLSFQPMRAFSE